MLLNLFLFPNNKFVHLINYCVINFYFEVCVWVVRKPRSDPLVCIILSLNSFIIRWFHWFSFSSFSFLSYLQINTLSADVLMPSWTFNFKSLTELCILLLNRITYNTTRAGLFLPHPQWSEHMAWSSHSSWAFSGL